MLTTNLLILALVLACVTGLLVLAKWVVLRFAAHGARSFVRKGDSRPKLVYFWTPTCAVCRASQTRIVDEVALEFGEHMQVFKINAVDDMAQAKAFGVMTVPTTVVLSADGAVHAVNTGLVDGVTLAKQLREAGAPDAAEAMQTAHTAQKAH